MTNLPPVTHVHLILGDTCPPKFRLLAALDILRDHLPEDQARLTAIDITEDQP